MKICSHCRKKLPLSEFHISRAKKDGLQFHCKVCHAEKMFEKQERKRRIVWDYLLVNPCIDCGERDPVVLEFDHISDDKVMPVAEMVKRGRPNQEIIAEMAKCQVRCANCHRRETAKRANNFKYRMSQAVQM